MSVIDEILGSIDPEQLAAAVGTDQQTAMDAAAAAIPTLINSLQANATASADGEASLLQALGQHADGIFGDQVDLGHVDTEDGRKIVAHALADDPQRLQALGGFGGGLLSKLLPLLAPIVMSYLSKKLLGGGASSGGSGNVLGDLLGGILGGGATQQSAGGGLGDLLGSILGGGSAQQSSGGGLGDLLGSVFGGQEPAAVPAGVGVDTSGQVFNAPDGSMQINTDAPVQTYEQPPQQQQQGGDILGDLLGQILGR